MSCEPAPNGRVLLVRRNTMRLAALAFFVFALTAPPASARPPEVSQALPNSERVGQAQYRALSIPLFSAETWAAGGNFSWNEPFALTLTYHRNARASTL